jgi:hypothetical protein
MTRRTVLRSLCALASAALTGSAAELSGKWTGTATTPESSENVLLILRVNGSYVEGSLGPSDGRNDPPRFPIEQGKLDGNKVSFQLTGPNKAVFKFELTWEGDSLRGPCTRTLEGQTEHGTVELKRAGS